MKHGDWMVTSQGVGIDVNGRLRDAHHRLSACVEANVSFETSIVWGLPEDAYQVIDRGLIRSYEDILDCSKTVAEVLRAAANLITGNGRPSRRDIDPLIRSGCKDALEALVKSCPSKTAYFSSASFKLGALARIINGVSIDFIYSQYRALVLADYDSMTFASKALTRQVTTSLQLSATNKLDVLARSLVVFDPARASVSKIQIDQEQRLAATEYVRKSLIQFVACNLPV